MNEIDEKIAFLEKRLENLVKSQIGFQQEISQIRDDLKNLRETTNFQPVYNQPVHEPPATQTAHKTPDLLEDTDDQSKKAQNSPAEYVPTFGYSNEEKSSPKTETIPNRPPEKSNVEKFIGENLISKIGIVILVLGVAIGAKYAIDNNLISPSMRIVLGYVFGFGLLGFAFKLKEKYLSFSAVLLSGAMAIMYFITFFAYSLYGIFPQTTTFVLMLIFTAFTVASAIFYNRQVIAQIGLVGAYAIPFLLSDNTGNYAFLFTYIAIINAGILSVSVKKYWKSLHFSSFIVTWLIFTGWFLTKYVSEDHFNLAASFLTVNFLTFYLTFIVYKIISNRSLEIENLLLILANSFIFYGFGYALLENREGFAQYQGLFTIINAGIHFVFAISISRLKLVPQELIYLLCALIITFATIAVPVQLDGNFVTLIWTVEAAMLFWIGRTKQLPVFESYSFPLMCLASVNLLFDWAKLFELFSLNSTAAAQTPFYNGNFFTALLFAAAFFFIYLTNRVRDFKSVLSKNLRELFGILTVVVFIFVFYNAFRIEIGNYFQSLTLATAAPPDAINYQRTDQSLDFFNIVWQINYTMLFLTMLSFINIGKVKNAGLAMANLALNALALFTFITLGLFILSGLREVYILQTDADIFSRGFFHILIRYVSYIFAAGLIISSYLYTKQPFVVDSIGRKTSELAFDLIFHVSLLFILSSELLNWMNLYGYDDSYKLGLSILWGIFALFLIIVGIYNHKKHLRIGAIVLFGITLAKLFLYDIAELNTISKTVVFVSLGILLLIVSFLYNKYKSLIFD